MELTQGQYERIARCFSKLRGALRYSHLEVLNAILYIAGNGAKWRKLERLFLGLKGFRRIFSRFEKLDAMFTAFIHSALIFDALLYLNTT